MSPSRELPVSVDPQSLRFTDREIVFHDQFTLGASPQIYPAGRYIVETGDRLYEGSEHTARVRSSTVLVVTTASGSRSVEISESELVAALAADAERHGRSPNENPDRGQADAAGKQLRTGHRPA